MHKVKNIFISHKFTDLTLEDIYRITNPFMDKLTGNNYNVFCSVYHEKDFAQRGLTTGQIYEYCCKIQKEMDMVLGLVWHDKESYGMRLELQQAMQEGQDYILVADKKCMNQEWIVDYDSYANDTIIVQDINNISPPNRDMLLDKINKIQK